MLLDTTNRQSINHLHIQAVRAYSYSFTRIQPGGPEMFVEGSLEFVSSGGPSAVAETLNRLEEVRSVLKIAIVYEEMSTLA